MANLSKPGTGVLLALVFVVACDSTSPDSNRMLRIQGEVLEAGQAPTPPLLVDIQAWPALESPGSDVATLRTDAGGLFRADLGPFPQRRIDSLRMRVTQSDCGLEVTTDLRREDLALVDDNLLVLPTLALSYRLRSAELGVGGAMCGAIVTRTSGELIGDYARLALWIDEISDSVRGRWRVNHNATIGDDYGYFSGSLELDRLSMELRPTQPTPCTGLQLQIPVGGDNGSTLGVGDLTGDGTCSVPSTALRFFEGAALPEVLPPNLP